MMPPPGAQMPPSVISNCGFSFSDGNRLPVTPLPFGSPSRLGSEAPGCCMAVSASGEVAEAIGRRAGSATMNSANSRRPSGVDVEGFSAPVTMAFTSAGEKPSFSSCATISG